MTKRRRFYAVTLSTPASVEQAIAESSLVRVYPSPKYPGVTMLQFRDAPYSLTGRLSDSDFEQIRGALAPFTAAPDKKATIYARKAAINVLLYLEYVLVAIESGGWKRANGSGRPTWMEALDLYNDRQPLTQTAIARTEEIIQVMSEPEESDYGRRLADILKQKETLPANLRMLASAPVAYDRRQARDAAARTSQHVGTPGESIRVDFLEVLYRGAVNSSSGSTWLYKLRDSSGNQYTCWHDEPGETRQMINAVMGREEDENIWHQWLEKHTGMQERLPERFAGSVTVVAHQQYQGVKETVIRVDSHAVRDILICPACGGRYDQGDCTCIAEPSIYQFEPGEFDVEIAYKEQS